MAGSFEYMQDILAHRHMQAESAHTHIRPQQHNTQTKTNTPPGVFILVMVELKFTGVSVTHLSLICSSICKTLSYYSSYFYSKALISIIAW